jgi:hypothetical protein
VTCSDQRPARPAGDLYQTFVIEQRFFNHSTPALFVADL